MFLLPKHIAFILDGNARWAQKKQLPITAGHREGLNNLERILDFCFIKKIKMVTIYAFSLENWKRSKEEKKILFDLLIYFFENKIDKVISNNTKIKIIGNIKLFPKNIQKKINQIELRSSKNEDFLLQIALSYGGRDEIIRGIKKVLCDYNKKKITKDSITEVNFTQYLDTFESNYDPDLLIRTGGEIRLSNFLLYQVAYTELYFTEVLWPDFSIKDLEKAMEWYSNRERRYGGRIAK